ncbi:AFG1/ZapE family ATPase [Methylosinus trichosporium]|uniref:AFG1/ZapE family ATPase n=1 Tax=Methylosinus trichosporium TaxID=426 RepID=UPI003D282F73
MVQRLRPAQGLLHRADDLEGASPSARGRRRLARKRSQFAGFGSPGVGKSHLAAALGLALIESGWRVLFARTTDLVQRLQATRRDLTLEAAIDKLDKYHLLVLDDLAYVAKDQAETNVLFELISARYERRSLLITANQPFGEWGKIFPDRAMTLAAIDRLVHHATIFEMNVDSYRRKTALKKAAGPGRPPAQQSKPHLDRRSASIKTDTSKNPLALLSLRDNHLVTATQEISSRLSRHKSPHCWGTCSCTTPSTSG